MEREKLFIPQVETKNIGPEIKLSQKEKAKRQERREKEDSLSKYILKWWKGDAHTHSKESTREGYGYAEGIYDIEEVMKYYQELGLDFVCFAEHSSQPSSPKKQSSESSISQSLLKEVERITKINKERKENIIALSGVETNIIFNENDQPALDLPPEILKKLDLVVASRHTIAKEKELKAIRESLLFAIKDPNVDLIGHPDRYSRKDKETSPEYWKEYWGIWPLILEEMVKNNKAFEINLKNPPSKKLMEIAAKTGVKFFINFDAHDFNQYKKEETELTKAGEGAKKKWAKEEAFEEDLEILKEYKMEKLSAGPGLKAILKLVRRLKKLESLGVGPEKIVNSSRDNLLNFLTKVRQKKTENLESLTPHSP